MRSRGSSGRDRATPGTTHRHHRTGRKAPTVSTVYSVPGMSCGHCVNAITAEVTQVPGVDGVDIDLEAKTVTVHGDANDGAVRAAIDEAGYEVVETASS